MDFIYNDGGRLDAGLKGVAGDCVVRAIAIASGKPYREVYSALFAAAKSKPRKRRGSTSPRDGVFRKIYEPYLLALGFKWTPTMKVGQGCKVHFVKDELPSGTLIVALSRHLTAVIDGVVYDAYNPSRGATYYYKPGTIELDHISPDRCVYGYYTAPAQV